MRIKKTRNNYAHPPQDPETHDGSPISWYHCFGKKLSNPKDGTYIILLTLPTIQGGSFNLKPYSQLICAHRQLMHSHLNEKYK